MGPFLRGSGPVWYHILFQAARTGQALRRAKGPIVNPLPCQFGAVAEDRIGSDISSRRRRALRFDSACRRHDPIMLSRGGRCLASRGWRLSPLCRASSRPEDLRSDIRKIKELTDDKPFAINQILLSPTAKANLAVVIEEKVPVVNYTLETSRYCPSC